MCDNIAWNFKYSIETFAVSEDGKKHLKNIVIGIHTISATINEH